MDKIYCGSGKTKASQYGEFYSISVCIDDIPAQFITVGKTGKRFIKINVSKKKQPDQFGNNLSITVDTFKPQEKPKPNYEQMLYEQMLKDSKIDPSKDYSPFTAATPPPAPWEEDNGELPF